MEEVRDRNNVSYVVDPPLSSPELNGLFAAAWDGHRPVDFDPILGHSLIYVCEYDERRLVGFVNVAWDGGVHGFVLDTTVHPEARRRGIGRGLVTRAVAEARDRNLQWLHVDFEPYLQEFYEGCGFRSTSAGLLWLDASDDE